LRGSPAFLRVPAVDFATAAEELVPEIEVRVLAPGQSTEID
jgi:hypothetical protein